MKSSYSSSGPHGARLGTLAALAALVGLAAWTSPAVAQLGASDVAGIRLGASAADVETTLRALDPRFKFLKLYFPDESGKAGNSVAAIKAAVQPGNDLRGIDWKRADGFAVYFAEGAGGAYAIYRQTASPQGFSIPQTLEALTKKYGPTLGSYPDIYIRNVDLAGKATSGCAGSGFGWQGGAGGYDPRCAQALRVQFDPKAPGVATGFQTWLFDHRIAQTAIQAAQAKQQAAAQEAARKQQESLRGNRPTL